MNIKQIIASAGRNRHTIILTAREKDGSVETREAEPYSYRIEKGREHFYMLRYSEAGYAQIPCLEHHRRPRNREHLCAQMAGRGMSLMAGRL